MRQDREIEIAAKLELQRQMAEAKLFDAETSSDLRLHSQHEGASRKFLAGIFRRVSCGRGQWGLTRWKDNAIFDAEARRKQDWLGKEARQKAVWVLERLRLGGDRRSIAVRVWWGAARPDLRDSAMRRGHAVRSMMALWTTEGASQGMRAWQTYFTRGQRIKVEGLKAELAARERELSTLGQQRLEEANWLKNKLKDERSDAEAARSKLADERLESDRLRGVSISYRDQIRRLGDTIQSPPPAPPPPSCPDCNTLRDRLGREEEQVQRLMRELSSMKERLIEDSGDAGRVEILQREIETANDRRQTSEKQNSEMKKDYEDRLATATKALEEEVSRLQKQIEQLNEEKELLNGEKTRDLAALEATLEATRVALGGAEEDKAGLKLEVDRLLAKLRDSDDGWRLQLISQEDNSRRRLNLREDELRLKSIEAEDELRLKSIEAEDESKRKQHELQDELRETQRKATEAEATAEEAAAAVSPLSEEILRLESLLSARVVEVDRLKKDNLDLRNDLEAATKGEGERQARSPDYLGCPDLCACCSSGDAGELQIMRDKLRAGEALIEEGKDRIRQLEAKEKEIQTLEGELTVLQAYVASREADLSSCRDDLSSLQKEKGALDARFAALVETHGSYAGMGMANLAQYVRNRIAGIERYPLALQVPLPILPAVW